MSRQPIYKLWACPNCEAETVVESAKGGIGRARRRRRCGGCGQEYVTTETRLGNKNAIPALFLLKALEEAGLDVDWSDLNTENEINE